MPVRIPTILVVCSYGCHLNAELTMYLEAVAAYVNTHRPHLMVLCGGATQQASAPDRTEAETMLQFLEEPGRLTHLPQLFLEETSYTSYENIRNAAVAVATAYSCALTGPDPLDASVVIFCEASRALKVSILARHFFGFPEARGLPHLEIRTVSWEKMHPLRELQGTIYDALSLYVPGLAWYWGWKRRRRAKRI
jgi:hypothetical protein